MGQGDEKRVVEQGCWLFRRGCGKWFVDNLKMRLGNGLSTNFGRNRGRGLCRSVIDFLGCFIWVSRRKLWWERWGFGCRGSGNGILDGEGIYFGMEIDCANDFMNLLDRFKLVLDKEDSWTWNDKSSIHGFVKKAYELISDCDQLQTRESNNYHIFRLVWKAMAPRNAVSMAWRLMRERLPTTDNLDKRGVILGGGVNCTCCGENSESVNHLVVGCKTIINIWNSMVQRVGLDSSIKS